MLCIHLMPRLSQWEDAVGRRVRLRDLFVFFTVLECGSMSKAAARLGVSTPSVSELVSDLEHAVGARLLDRSPRGVVATAFGEALLTRGQAAFDELRQGIREIESIADPASGEVRIGCPESCAAFLALVIERISHRYPRMRFSTSQVYSPTVEFPELIARKVDLVLARLVALPKRGRLNDDLEAQVLFDDPFFAVVGEKSKWARRRKIDLADLAKERWIMPALDVLAGLIIKDTFEAHGLKAPQPHISTFSILLRTALPSRGEYIAVLPRSVLRLTGARHGLRVLPIGLASARPSPYAIVTLKNRSLTPAVRVFLASAREAAKDLGLTS
jgi:DNA-binding transcriptional LysR family regulator